MPTISDLKEQARTLEQQGQLDKALTIYQHILKHLKGTPALSKVLPLYVKAGDLLHKMDRQEEAVASYQTAAEHYAASGAAPRVTALCGKIIRLAPERRDVYTDFVRQLIDHGHVGSARDVLADYARYAGMDRAIETLDDLAGRPNSEVQPMLERLLSSFEEDDQSDQAAERVSTQLEQVTDSLAGELAVVPETTETTHDPETAGAEEAEREDEDAAAGDEDSQADESSDGTEPLTPPMLDLDRMPRISSIHEAIRLVEDEEGDGEGETDDEPAEASFDADDGKVAEEEKADDGFEISRDVTPTMEGVAAVSTDGDEDSDEETSEGFEVEHSVSEDAAGGGDDLNALLADAVATDDTSETSDSDDTPGVVEIEGSEWKPDVPEPKAEETVAAEWAPEEELRPAARYPSDEYEKPDPDDTDDDRDDEAEARAKLADSDALDDEIAKAVEGFGEPATKPTESEALVPISEEKEPVIAPPDEPETPEEVERRPSRPPRMMVPAESDTKSKSPMLFGIGGLIVGALAGAGLTFVLVGGGSDTPPVVEQPAVVVDTPLTRAETPVAPPPAPEVATPVTTDTVEGENPDSATLLADSTAAAATTPGEVEADSTPAAAETEQPEDLLTPTGNPIVVDGYAIDEISEIEYRGLAGYRVVHLLSWGDPIVIEAYRDTSVTRSDRIQVDVTPPDTVVGIRRLDGYMVYASGVMPEDSLRSLMMRLVEGERQN